MSQRPRQPGLVAGLLLFGLTAASACESPKDQPDEPKASTAEQASAAPETPGVEWADPVTVAEGGGHKGPWRMNKSRFHYVDDPTVDILDDGTVGVTWVDNEAQTIRYRAFGPGGEPVHDTPVDVSRSPGTFSWLPRMVMAGPPSNHVYILWQEIVFSGGSHGGEAFFARSTDGGETFGEPINLSKTKNGVGKGRLTEEIWHNGSLDLTLGPDGMIHVAWTAYEGPLHVARSTDAGKTFSEPIHVAGDGDSPARAPTIAVEADGRLYLAWAVGEDKRADLRLATSSDGGETFGEPEVILESDGHSDAPKLAVDDRGTLHLVYGESPKGMFRRYHVRYARKPSDTAAFGESRRISPPDDEPIGANFPSLALDGEGNLFVIWNRYPTGDQPPRGLGFTASFDRGRSFVAPSVVPGSADPTLGFNGSLQGMLMRKLAANASGDLAAVNSRFKPDEASRIRLYRGETALP